MGAILNILGEHYRRREEVDSTVREYEALLETIKEEGLDACLSIKLTQFGLGIDEDLCRERVGGLRDLCKDAGVFLWFDMESSEYTSATLRIYRESLKAYPMTGICLQANLRRTLGDLEGLLPEGVVRLCKGAYREDADIAYRTRLEVDGNFRTLMHVLFRKGRRFALATHDGRLIREGLELQKERPREVEFQMLLGVQDPLKEALQVRHQRVLEYIPYGPRWLQYFSRRLRERPRNLIIMLRSFLTG